MSRTTLRIRLPALVTLACVVAACGSFDIAPRNIASSLTPYKVEVVQGNFVSREQVETLRPGMSRQQVKEVLGTPLMASIFHADRWDYVFTLKRQGVEPQSRKFTVYFKGNVMERFEGDNMPSESEFVATLDKRKVLRAIPVLEATEDKLAKFPASSAAAASAPSEPPAQVTYPPLEPPQR